MSSWRCSICSTDWPAKSPYERCPQCGEKTWFDRYGDPDPDYRVLADEAWRERRAVADDQGTKTESWRDSQVSALGRWLDTVTADDFRI